MVLALPLVLGLSLFSPCQAGSDTTSAIPTVGFAGDHYSTLWTKSPFAIATPQAAAANQDYQLTGLAQFDGVSYASLVDKQNQEHFILTSTKPARNLTLISVSHSANGGSAIVLRNGERLILQQENAAPAFAMGQPPPAPPFNPGAIAAAPANPSVGGFMPSRLNFPPPVRIHRPRIIVPPAPQ